MKTDKHWKDIFDTVIAQTDFIIEVLNARNPLGTQNYTMEEFVHENRPKINIFIVLNKADCIPDDVLHEWVAFYRYRHYHVNTVSAKYNRGVRELLSDLRHAIFQEGSNILIVGYPNVGKSSLIEALTKGSKKAGVSSTAGFTRSIKRIKLNDRIYLIDTPGVIPIDENDETEIAIKACMVADKIQFPESVVESIMQLVPIEKFENLYGVNLERPINYMNLIEVVGRRLGRLKSGGIVNEPEVLKHIIRDWQNNRLIYHTKPPIRNTWEKYSQNKTFLGIKNPSELEKSNNDFNEKNSDNNAGSFHLPPSIRKNRKL